MHTHLLLAILDLIAQHIFLYVGKLLSGQVTIRGSLQNIK